MTDALSAVAEIAPYAYTILVVVYFGEDLALLGERFGMWLVRMMEKAE